MRSGAGPTGDSASQPPARITGDSGPAKNGVFLTFAPRRPRRDLPDQLELAQTAAAATSAGRLDPPSAVRLVLMQPSTGLHVIGYARIAADHERLTRGRGRPVPVPGQDRGEDRPAAGTMDPAHAPDRPAVISSTARGSRDRCESGWGARASASDPPSGRSTAATVKSNTAGLVPLRPEAPIFGQAINVYARRN